MGLAVPTSVMVAIGRAAQLGVLVRSGAALERGHQVTALVLDKTGTLTEGHPAVVAWHPTSDAPPGLAAWLVAAQRQSEHPLAQAIVRKRIDVVLADLSEPWPTPRKPGHE